MKISYNWLSQYVDHGLTPAEVADALTMSGLEVDDVETLGAPLDGVYVGYVRRVRPHPNADRLTLCEVDLGPHGAVQIVCGAPNVAAGQKAPVAAVGAVLMLPSRSNPLVRAPLTIEKRAVRGETSEGMICAEDELGLSDDHAGIMVLDADAVVGQPFAEYLLQRGRAAQDHIIDVSITPNRPDATSHIGMARDLAALRDRPLRLPEVAAAQPGGEAAARVSVRIEAPEACRRYVGVLVEGVSVGESPEWLQQRLTAVGLRPRNNVVDVTNFVLFECGQPLHAFDYDQLAEGRIGVRRAAPGETFVTLDSRARALPEGALVITDGRRPVAIAGIMGGENSEVTAATRNVLIESAYFDPSTIRRTAKALGLQTDSSYRFERGVNPEQQPWAALRAAELIVACAGGRIAPGFVDEHPAPAEERRVRLRLPRIARVLGEAVPTAEVRRLLTAIGFEIIADTTLASLAEDLMEGKGAGAGGDEADTLELRIPAFRPDITREIDVIEEIARLYGFDRIAAPPRIALPAAVPAENPGWKLRRRARSLLAGLGFRELYTNSMLRTDLAARFEALPNGGAPADGGVVETLNPISAELTALQPSLLPGVLQAMSYNRNHGQEALRFFEFGHVFRRTTRPDVYVPGYAEHESLIVALAGPRGEASWDAPAAPADLFDVKGVVERLLGGLGLADVAFEAHPEPLPGLTAHTLGVRLGGREVGCVARLADEAAQAADLRTEVYVAELNWSALQEAAAARPRIRYAPVSRFPAVARDLAVVVEAGQPVGPLLTSAQRAGGPLLRAVRLFDIYTGPGVPEGRKSVALSLRFAADRTLQDAEVDEAMQRILAALAAEHQAALR